VPVGLVRLLASQLAIVGKLLFSINLPRRAELLLIFKSGRGYTKKEDSRLAERRERTNGRRVSKGVASAAIKATKRRSATGKKTANKRMDV
jgi:hypothetical protein